jgi:hypothetical protein
MKFALVMKRKGVPMNNRIEQNSNWQKDKVTVIPGTGSHPALRHVQRLAKLMDAQFSIPGTNYRFGLDGLLGLIPGAGDLSTFAVSGYMIWIMANNGASGFVLARMVLNVLVDALVGSIPILGDLFDFAFKANMRNVRLMEQHYAHGRYKGGAWKVVVPVLILLFLVIAAIIWGVYSLLARIF